MIHEQSSVILCILIALQFVQAQVYLNYPIADLSTSWTNSDSASNSCAFTDGSELRAILLRGTWGLAFACGFYCNGFCDTYLFAIAIVELDNITGLVIPGGSPQVVWSANRNNPVGINATLQLTLDGDLILKDADGTLVWSTGTSGRSTAGLNMTVVLKLIILQSATLGK